MKSQSKVEQMMPIKEMVPKSQERKVTSAMGKANPNQYKSRLENKLVSPPKKITMTKAYPNKPNSRMSSKANIQNMLSSRVSTPHKDEPLFSKLKKSPSPIQIPQLPFGNVETPSPAPFVQASTEYRPEVTFESPSRDESPAY
jgi:hypothetical protein